ncbi:S8 family serine peptidase [Mucilaginibacter sp. BT774]|uniref:S8 family serine peptidase n=1 Tax=Mucilaginibacter sp. BT774 TaxID=3062276 RepID=UPI00267685EA|nr:S8 family serine peptidase [Mucilaginibacter sp. BT774]MDO3626985.1 S8 family serine peptidase [Mucilaginibacter sp. BT774]
MKKRYSLLLTCVLGLIFANTAFCQQPLVSADKKKELDAISVKANSSFARSQQQALSLASSKGWIVSRKTKKGGIQVLQGISRRGFPIYFTTDDNVISAATTSTNTVQPGGSLGLNLSGSSSILNNKLAVWDGGAVYRFHQEFSGKTITIADTSSIIDHATHVAGTMLAKGVYPPVKGMAFNASTLLSYDFNNDVAEMSKAAPGLLLSNHSYGELGGWVFDDSFNRWEWYGIPGDTVDYTFGFYGDHTQAFDKVAYTAPYYLIVEAAGNAHGSTGPAVGQDYYGYKSASDQTFVDKGPRPDSISSNNGYDCISSTANAKNILTVGAVDPLPYGPANSQSITTAYFSSWGPTDDGRIKPDIVGNGLNVLSTGSNSTTSYITLSGTSQAAPNITGSLYLLQEYYAQKNSGAFMRAATLKGLACHTAFDAGNVGPDYIYGWGLLDMKTAAQAITDNGTKSQIKENTLAQGATQTFNVVASGNGPFVATISWTDPAGSITPDGTINDRTPKLVNDLDIRISDGTTTYLPWVLDPNNPSATAATGDNIRDNVEQVYVSGAIPGKSYTIKVSHKRTLMSGSQAYSLIITGIGGSAYCASAPLSSADSRIDNVTLSNINNTPSSGCTTYSDYTNLTIRLEQNKTYPLSLTLGTCGANFNKAAKVYIDWNGNGVFDANELVATTNIINATGIYTANITVPSTVVPGNFSLMRVVLTETSDTSTIKPCGSYAKGETQDYRVQFLQTSLDAGVIAVVNPSPGGNCSGSTPVTVTIKNFGSQTITNIPITVTITAPDNTVTTFNQLYTASLAPLTQDNFTFNNVFNITSGSTYIITATASLTGDLVPANNGIIDTVAIDNPPTGTDLSANYCNVANAYLMTGAGEGELLWYKNNNDTYPFAYGSTVLTSDAPVNNTYYVGLNDFSGTVGPATKNVFTAGGYNQFTPEVNVFTRIPVIIESARLYIGNSGRITFNVSNSSGEIVSTTSINAVATASNPSPGAKSDDPTDQGQVYNLNLLLPSAGNYSISATYDNTATIYRSNGGVRGYPFKIGDVFGITGNTATSAGDTTYYRNFYYYFYDIQLKSPGCASASRQAVPVTKPVITQNGTTLSSSATANNQWYLNGTLIPGATGQTYSPTQSGNYRVEVSLANGCVAKSDNFAYVILPANPGENDIGLTVFPNPANTQINVLFAANSAVNVNLSLVNIIGENEYTDKVVLNGGNFSTLIDVSKLAPGNYVLRLLYNYKLYTRKIIIVR